MSAPIVAALILCLMAIYYVTHRIAHAIVTEYGLLGGFIAGCVLYAISLIMDRRGL
jgi:hypothetical protein